MDSPPFLMMLNRFEESAFLFGEIGGADWSLFLPVIAGLGYAIGAIIIKRGMLEGVGPWRTTFLSNLSMGLVSIVLLFVERGNWQGWIFLYQPFLLSISFFSGQIFTFLALSRGDVSVATPLMGTKILFVAFFSILIMKTPIGWALWGAAILAVLAVFLLGAQTPNDPRKIGITVFFALCSAACFGFTDAMMMKWVEAWNYTLFIPLLFLGVSILSFAFIPFFRSGFSTISAKAWKWILPGILVLAIQSIGFAVILGVFRRATEMNILYSIRGLWSVSLVWLVGHWFGNYEGNLGNKVLVRRLAGAGLLVLAVVLVVFQ